MKETKKDYQKDYIFSFPNFLEFDHKKIAREVLIYNPNSAGFVLFGSGAGTEKNCLLSLFNTFLSQFYVTDNQVVCGEKLCSNWGISRWTKLIFEEGECRHYWKEEDNSIQRNLSFKKEQIDSVLREVEAAKKFKRSVSFKVKIL